MPIYACVDNRDIIEIDVTNEIPKQNEMSINGHSYRRLDPVFLAWIEQCVLKVVNDPRIDTEYVGELIDFLGQCKATGVKPVALASIPAGYRKPNIADGDWVAKLDW